MKVFRQWIFVVALATTTGSAARADAQCKQNINCFHGTCDGDSCECTCYPALGYWSGDDCLQWNAGPSDCSQLSSSGASEPQCQRNINCFHGSCNGDTCECSCYPSLGRWTGSECSEWVSGTSDCSAPLDAQQPLCSANENCFHGTCDDAGICQCRSFPGMGAWTGEQCDEWQASAPAGTNVVVFVADAVSGRGIAGASVSLLHVEASRTAPFGAEVSDAMGFASFSGVPVGDMVIVVVSGVAGYAAASTTLIVAASASSVTVDLAAATYTTTVQYSASAPVVFEEAGGEAPALSITLPPGFLPAELDGKTLRLEATVASDAVPGTPSLAAAVDGGGGRVSLETLGMVDLTITDVESGEVVRDFTSGLTAAVAFEVRASDTMAAMGLGAGDQVPLWHFSEESGVWEQKGMGELVEDGAGLVRFAFQADSFSWWNCDRPWTTSSCVTVKVCKSGSGPTCEPYPDVDIDVTGVGYNLGAPRARTGPDGTACVHVKKGSTNDFSATNFGVRSPVERVATSNDNPGLCTDSWWLPRATGPLDPCASVELVLPGPSCATFSIDASAVPGNVSSLRLFQVEDGGRLVAGTVPTILPRPFPSSFCLEGAQGTSASVSAYGVFDGGIAQSVGTTTVTIPSTPADITGGCGACVDSGETMSFEVINILDAPSVCVAFTWLVRTQGQTDSPPAANLPVFSYYYNREGERNIMDACLPGEEDDPAAWIKAPANAVYGGQVSTNAEGVAMVDIPLELMNVPGMLLRSHIGGCNDSLPQYDIPSFYITGPARGFPETWPYNSVGLVLHEVEWQGSFWHQWRDAGFPTGSCSSGAPPLWYWPQSVSRPNFFPSVGGVDADGVPQALSAEERASAEHAAGSNAEQRAPLSASSTAALAAVGGAVLLLALVAAAVSLRRQRRAAEVEQAQVDDAAFKVEMTFFTAAAAASPAKAQDQTSPA